jgi:DNA repair exonuclease SbcCD nuclease subunit
LRLIHTADWQIGKVFRFVDDATMGVLQEARLEAISTIGRLAMERAAPIVLVAGDVYDQEEVSARTLGQPIERMRAFPAIEWHLLPGNHDPHRSAGIWDRVVRHGLPEQVHVHLEPRPVAIAGGAAWLLPAALAGRRVAADPTGWMDDAPAAADVIRIGLAHGSIATFGSHRADAPNYIAPDRPERAHLDYLALGDWHGAKQIGPRCWYAGTPEPDRFDQPEAGRVLLVEIEAARALPQVLPVETARYEWRREQVALHGPEDIDRLEQRFRQSGIALDRLLIDLKVGGALSLADRQTFEHRIVRWLGAASCWLQVDDDGLLPAPSADDLDAMASGGVLRDAALRLKAIAEAPEDASKELAARALVRLYLELRKTAPA